MGKLPDCMVRCALFLVRLMTDSDWLSRKLGDREWLRYKIAASVIDQNKKQEFSQWLSYFETCDIQGIGKPTRKKAVFIQGCC